MKMINTYQTKTQNIWEHGQSVWYHTEQLITGNFQNFRLPEWFIQNHHFLVNNLHNWETIKMYAQLHDVGKPFCVQVDELGKQHFPNHDKVSKDIFLRVFPDKVLEAELIGLDMLLHKENWKTIQDLNLPIKTLCTLLIVAFAEIHSNAALFGGINSNSFKMKFKRLDKVGKRIVEGLGKHQDTYGYIFVRKDLPAKSHIAVQAAHALFEKCDKNKEPHPSIILLSAENESELKQIMSYLLIHNIQFYVFREPMEPYENTITAVATENLDSERKKLLSQYKLLSL
jgi:hypothetical protein